MEVRAGSIDRADKMFLVRRQVVTIEVHAVSGVVDTRRVEIGRPLICDLRRYVCMHVCTSEPACYERTQDERTNWAKRQDLFSSSGISSSRLDRDTKDTFFLSNSRTLSRALSICKNRLKMARHLARKRQEQQKSSLRFLVR